MGVEWVGVGDGEDDARACSWVPGDTGHRAQEDAEPALWPMAGEPWREAVLRALI